MSPAYVIVEPEAGDRWLLCSDGLTAVVTNETIEQEMLAAADPKTCCERLIDLALRGGGPDNVTVIVADLTAGD